MSVGIFVGFFSVITFVVAVGLQPPPAPPPPPASPSPGPTPTVVAVPSPAPSIAPTPSPTATVPATPAPTPLGPNAPLDGVAADPELGHRLPIAVMVDDNARTRPQAGFNRASIVYQAPNDGGEDRYMLIFQEQDADLVGNIRSTRPYFAAWASEYGAALGHYGGDWVAIRLVRQLNGENLYDLDALRGAGRAYWRDRSVGRAPFNAFTSTERLRAVAESRGAPTLMAGGLSGRQFVDDLPADQRPASGSIDVPYRRGATSYEYDHATNSYLRSVAGKAQRDRSDNSRVVARNVIVQFVSLTYNTTERHNRVEMSYVGTGRALVFRDGQAIEGTWRKKGNSGLTQFLDSKGDEVTLVRGPIYIQAVPDNAAVTYKIGE